MKTLVTTLLMLAVAALVFPVQASELDNESDFVNVEVPEFEGTVVVRVNRTDNSVERLVVDVELSDESDLVALTGSEGFEAVPTSQIVGELDQDSGQSSWYYYWPSYRYWNTGYYYYYGNWYRPYYRYSVGNYYYYYYNRWYRWY